MPALALALGAVVALLAGRLLAPRAPALLRGVGLVLLLVAALRALGDAGELLTSQLPDFPGAAVALAVGVAAGAGTWLLARGRPRVRGPVCAAAVVLAQAPLLASVGSLTYDVPVDLHLTPSPSTVPLLLLAGLLAGGALAAGRPGVPAALLAVGGLVGLLLLPGAVDPLLLRLLCAGPAVAVLVPALLEEAGLAVHEVPGARLGQGALAGVVLVLLAAAVPPALAEGMPRRYADHQPLGQGALPGLQVLSNEAYSSTLQLQFDVPPLVPGLGLLHPGGSGWFGYAPLQSGR